MLHASKRIALTIAVGGVLLPACDRDSPPSTSSQSARSAQPATRPASSAAPATTPPAPAGSSDTSQTADAATDPLEFVPPGSPIIPLRPIEFAVYQRGPVTPALTAELEQKARARFPGVKLLTKPEPGPPPTLVVFSPDMENLQLPSAAEFADYGRGLNPAQLEGAASSKGATLFGWLLDGDPKYEELRKAQGLVLEVAQKNSGFVWDDASHELFSPQSWRTLRVDGWQGDIPYASRHYTTRYYKAGGHGRLVTLGLGKLGLPDLVVDDVPVMKSAAMVTIVGAIAQLLVEGATVGPAGRFVVDWKAMHHAAAGAGFAHGVVATPGKVTLVAVDPVDGDAENRLAEVRVEGDAVREILGAVPDQMAGAEGADPQLRAIAQRVQARLPALAAAFQKGLPAGAELYVKVPYASEGESYGLRWISVAAWKGSTIRGVLRNEPAEGQAHDVGEPVEVKQGSVADYLLHKADGAQEGGESLKPAPGRAGGRR